LHRQFEGGFVVIEAATLTGFGILGNLLAAGAEL
jgi:hypothetical protein